MVDLVVIGAGGHSRVVIDALASGEAFRVAGVVGLPTEVGGTVLGVPVVGTEADLGRLRGQGIAAAVVAIGSVGDPWTRVRAAEAARAAGMELPVIAHASAVISPYAQIGAGSFIAAGAIVGPGAKLGECAIINSGAIVDHDCTVGAYAHLSPGVALSGGVVVGERTHVGTGTSVVHYVSIGADVLLGAGSVVVDDVRDGVVAYGNPARFIKSRT